MGAGSGVLKSPLRTAVRPSRYLPEAAGQPARLLAGDLIRIPSFPGAMPLAAAHRLLASATGWSGTPTGRAYLQGQISYGIGAWSLVLAAAAGCGRHGKVARWIIQATSRSCGCKLSSPGSAASLTGCAHWTPSARSLTWRVALSWGSSAVPQARRGGSWSAWPGGEEFTPANSPPRLPSRHPPPANL